jgi:8-oxo-dGTP pyrophosphatase MutT (NUDIX family)
LRTNLSTDRRTHVRTAPRLKAAQRERQALATTFAASHAAAVCYRIADGEVEFLLVRTRSGKWTFPKGGVDGDATLAAAAGREAYEEAGVRGRVESSPFASYLHFKRGSRQPTELKVSAHLCRVFHLEAAVERHRDPTWFSFKAAMKRVRQKRRSKYAAELERVLQRAFDRIRRRSSTH